MTRGAVIFLLGVILFLFGGYITLDWFQFITGIANFARPELPYVRATKVAVSFLSAILVFIIGRDGFDRKDTIRLILVYAAIAIGDIFLVFDINMVGMLVFAVAHVFFIIRNGWGLRAYLTAKSGINRFWDIVTAFIILAIAGGIMGGFFLPVMGGGLMFYMLLGYSVFLGVSLWMAWAAVRIGYMPKGNAWLAAIGLSCFFVSDLLVGVHFATQPGRDQTFAIYLTWIFYTPGLVLPALSGYRLSRITG
ncbi:MAG: lysoplasmalogenase family protein [Chloroflexi bacterium]|nr:lysoplasmalogenase family protein [Chloroflexota bacterium]